SLEPVIDKVGSQMFKEEMKNANLTQSIGLGLLVGAIGMLFLSEDVKDWNSGQKTAYWSLLGLSVASNYLSFHFINNAAKEHNKSLKQKLNLGLEASLRY
ncbi:MAG: hypothetical protein NXH75_00385, partial [Halobacteriovoraceae bacterium]|nr:hypothetical protein [Halobacteriovoraceae bacterium]